MQVEKSSPDKGLSGELDVSRELKIEETAPESCLLRGGRSRRGLWSHVVHVMVVMMMVVMMVMVHHRRRRFGGLGSGAGRGAGDRRLREGVSAEAERENGRRGKGLDHERTILWLGKPKWVSATHSGRRLNSI
jgi:hypothetical protein